MVKQECPQVAAAMGNGISTTNQLFPLKETELNPSVATARAECWSARYRRQSAQIKGQETAGPGK